MKTEFLKGLGLTDDQVTQIMAEHGRDINGEKAKVKAAEDSLADVREKLKAFDGVNVDELKTSVATLKSDLDKKDKDYAAKLADLEFDRVLEASLSGSKARNTKAVAALLDVAALKASKNQGADIMAALESIKKDNSYLFETEQPQRFNGPTGGPNNGGTGGNQPPQTAQVNDALRVIAGKQSS